MYSIKRNKVYKCDFLNEHLGHLKFSYKTWQSFRKENLNAKSRKDQYVHGSTSHVVTSLGKTYNPTEWIQLVEAKIKELKEWFIFNELLNKNSNAIIEKDSEDVYFDTLVSYTYRFWERASDPSEHFLSNDSRNTWLEFNALFESKYPKEMRERLISTYKEVGLTEPTNNIEEQTIKERNLLTPENPNFVQPDFSADCPVFNFDDFNIVNSDDSHYPIPSFITSEDSTESFLSNFQL